MLAAASLDLKAEKQSAHSGWVMSAAFNNDGTKIVSGSDDATIKVWDAVNFRAHVESEWKKFDKEVNLAKSWEEPRMEIETWWRNTITGHEQGVKPSGGVHMPIEPRDDQSVGCGCVGTDTPEPSRPKLSLPYVLQLPWSSRPRSRTRTARPCAPWPSHPTARPSSRAPTTRPSKSGMQVCRHWHPPTLSPDLTAPVLAAASLEFKAEKHSDWVKSVAFSPDGKTIVSGSYDETLKVWDAGTPARLIPHLDEI